MAILKSKFFWTVLLSLGIVTAFVALTPRAIDMDLGKIGDGRKAVVFIYDPNLLASNQQSTEMNSAHAQLGDKALFLIAKIGDPTSAEFRQQHKARTLDLLFFNEQGELTGRGIPIMDAQALVQRLSEDTH